MGISVLKKGDSYVTSAGLLTDSEIPLLLIVAIPSDMSQRAENVAGWSRADRLMFTGLGM